MKKNESIRTATFVCCGLALAVAAGVASYATAPTESADFEKVGQPFFPEFTTAADARSLEVYAVDPESATMKDFRISQKDGTWVIPSHYDYPAEANYRIAQTATSLIGIERDSLVGRLESDYEKFGVVDPLSEDISELDAMGKRLTMKDADGDILADYIIGKQADEVEIVDTGLEFNPNAEPEKYYYVRRADEKQTYKVKFDIDLSTRFTDWIEPDLLQVAVPSVSRLDFDNYQLREIDGRPGQLAMVRGDQITLTRNEEFGAWELEDIFAEQEQLVQQTVESILGVLGDLRVAGVRPKYRYKEQQLIKPDLTIYDIPELEADPELKLREFSKLQNELEQRGFGFAEDPELRIVSNGGMMRVGTKQGVLYTLSFGKSVVGDEDEIQIGSSDPGDPEQNELAESESAESESADSEDDGADENADGESSNESNNEPEAKNRYLMIRVAFDETLLGSKPVVPEIPVEPVKPEGYVVPPDVQPTDDMEEKGEVERTDDDLPPTPDSLDEEPGADENEKAQEGEQDVPVDPPTVAREEEKRPREFREYDTALANYQDADTQYAIELTRYEADVEAFIKRVDAGQEVVNDLNERYGNWYYVISADNLSALQVARADLVEPVERADKPLEDPPEMFHQPGFPERPNIDFELPEDFDSRNPDDVEADGIGR